MTDQGKEQQINVEPDNVAVTRNFLEAHKVPLAQGLIDILHSSRIVLVGDRHTPSGGKLRVDLTSSLTRLQSEGGVTGIAVELDSNYQQEVDALEVDNPNLETIIADIAPVGWDQGNITFLVAAKRLGLRIICIDLIDKQKLDSQRDSAQWQNRRDAHMFETLGQSLNPEDKIIALVGFDHIQKRAVKGYQDGRIIPLGMRLTEKYGDSLIKSIRPVYREDLEHFDNLLHFMSKTPTVAEIVTKEDLVAMVPDEGPIKGDSRVTATDYVVIA